MKKTLIFMMVALLAASCEKVALDDVQDDELNGKNIRLNVNGDFGAPTFTRTLSADGHDMTDLWVFDYVDDECVQVVHQTDEDVDFGSPELLMTFGAHSLYIVASRGVDPDVDDVEHTIIWTGVRDTFWNGFDCVVTNETASEQDVTLNRVVAKLKCSVNDKIPDGTATLLMEPECWYYGIDYVTGEPTAEDDGGISINVPSSYIGTSGVLAASFYTISGADEWTTDFTLSSKNGNNAVISSVGVDNAPLKANRATIYSGNLFSSGGMFTFTLDYEWMSDKVLTW